MLPVPTVVGEAESTRRVESDDETVIKAPPGGASASNENEAVRVSPAPTVAPMLR